MILSYKLVHCTKWVPLVRHGIKCYATDTPSKSKPFYILPMFPYPSGSLHMGHLRVYTISDVLARYHRMQGYKAGVIHPIGWDAFGLPAENAAIDRQIQPAEWTQQNIANMKLQLKQMNVSFDWDREISTCDPSYYKFTQQLFLDLYKAGLVYKKEALVNWDPIDQTVLANEQVDAQGRTERSGALVEQKSLNQWFIKITDKAEALLQDLDGLDWPMNVKQLQANWIGKSEGMLIDFRLQEGTLSVFTSRPDTLMGVEFIAISPEHPLIDSLPSTNKQHILHQHSQWKQSHEIHGLFTGVYAKHPIQHTDIPIYVASYVKQDYATGAVMGVPAHDERDWQFYHDVIQGPLIKPILSSLNTRMNQQGCALQVDTSQDGTLINVPAPMLGMTVKQAHDYILDKGIKEGWGHVSTQYRIRDWLISRQRYWGTPIPMIYCQECGTVPVPPEHLPVVLPRHVTLQGRGGSVLKELKEWKTCTCPNYCDTNKDVLPVDIYVGGVEHAILHLLYARFIAKFMKDQGISKMPQGEPFKRLLTQGMVRGKTYKCPTTGRIVKPSLVQQTAQGYVVQSTQQPVVVTWEKMSKSKYNGVDPMTVMNQYGTDATRLFILYKAAPQDELPWDESAIVGMQRFLSKIKSLSHSPNKDHQGIPLPTLDYHIHSTIAQVNKAMTQFSFNTAIGFIIKLTNILTDIPPSQRSSSSFITGLETVLKLVAPFAPETAESCWSSLYPSSSVFDQPPCKVDPKALIQSTGVCVVMINGKTRGTFTTDSGLDKEALIEKAKLSPIGLKWIPASSYRKVIVIDRPQGGHVVNFIV